MKETLKLGIILFVFTVVSAGVLAVSNNATKGKIAELEMAGSIGALQEIFGEDVKFQPLEENKQNQIIEANPSVVEIFEALNGDSVVGYAIKNISKGFGGDLLLMTGFNIDGTVSGMRVLEHSETPGLGARSEEPEFTNRFIGLSTADDITVEALSGATGTTNGVLAGVNSAREIFNSELSN
ncbi:MAG: RnfABCDGE type electron transport complex subunit G [Tissierellaceae bacterium]|nr:RnfABCDGE type electron transport complex subunit G [Tissierellaceae bacterium]